MPIVIIGQFCSGVVEISPEVKLRVSIEERVEYLARHVSGDWGDLEEFEWTVNDDALTYGGRLVSRYRTRYGMTLYIVTADDRSVTTIMMREEYFAAAGFH